MKPDRLSVASLVVGSVALVAAVVTGVFGAYVSSLVAVALMLVVWGGWVTWRILTLSRAVLRDDQETAPRSGGDHPERQSEPVSPIRYGDVIKLRHATTRCALHSHSKQYVHEGSSQQQQVTAFSGSDPNDYWLVKGPHGKSEEYAKGQLVANGNVIRLEHLASHKNLHSHEGFLAPLSRHQEVSAFGESGVGDRHDNWRVELALGDIWEQGARLRLVHLSTGCALHSHSGKADPHLTSGQQEVTCYGDRDDNDWWCAESSSGATERRQRRSWGS